MVVTIGTIVAPPTRLAVDAPQLRVGLEVTGLCLVLFAAVMLALPEAEDVRPARDAFVAALVVLGLANGVLAVMPVLSDGRLAVDRGLGFYPWIAARFVSGALFLAAALERPRLGLARTVGAGLALLVAVEGLLIASGDRFPVPVRIGVGPGRVVELVDPLSHAVFEILPGIMFAVGAWLAGRLYQRSAAPAHLWLSLALLLQVFTQVHEVLYPAIIGPIVTTADVFRSSAFAALAIGGVTHFRRLYRTRSRTVERQAEDLARQAVMVDRMARLAREEQDVRTLVTHELATPIAAIRAYSHVLRAHHDALPPAALRAAESIDAEARRLHDLVGRMDELSDVERDELPCELQPVRAQPLVMDAVRFAQGLLGVHPISAECPDVRVMADPVRLGQLLRNLLTNAVRYAPPQSPIAVNGRMVGDRRLALSVTDHGPGIPAHERSRVLERYARGSTSNGTDGHGIGLYLAARIAEGHGDRLRIADTPEPPGTVVTVELEVVA